MLKNRAVKSMRKKISTSVLMLAWCISMTVSVCAASAAAVMGTYTGESDLSVYVRGTDLGKDDVNVQIGNLEADKVRTQLVEELDMPMQTLIMVDNSLSITPKNQKKISRFLQYLISDRLANEEIGIATFSEEARKLVDYTSEYEALMRAADNISYQRQSTYLTDALYDLMKAEYIENPTDTFRRILVISDGVDNKSIGYTKEELYSLIKDLQIPVYTIGCKNGKNNEELENMFALSRITNAEYFLLDKVKAKDLLDITSALKQDRTAVKLTITPPKEQMDGSRKAVKITFPNHSPLTAEMMMPQPILEEEPQQTDSREDETEKPEPKSNEEEKTGLLVIVLIAGGIAAAVAAFFLNQRKKNRQQEPDFERIEHEIDRQIGLGSEASALSGTAADGLNQPTEIVDQKGRGGTLLLWNQHTPPCQIILTDVHTPSKSFQVSLDQPVRIGRNDELCSVVLDYDRSVSGKHCEISAKDGRFYVKDLHSSNKTYVNGSEITTETEIVSGSILKLGRLELRFEEK